MHMSATKNRGADSPHLELRSQLMDAVRHVIRDRGLRQREAAELFGVAQPRVSDLVRGKVALFSIDTLVSMLAAAGVLVELRLHFPSAREGNDVRRQGRAAAIRRDRPRSG